MYREDVLLYKIYCHHSINFESLAVKFLGNLSEHHLENTGHPLPFSFPECGSGMRKAAGALAHKPVLRYEAQQVCYCEMAFLLCGQRGLPCIGCVAIGIGVSIHETNEDFGDNATPNLA